MKKGLRRSQRPQVAVSMYSNRRPDEEGIKTGRGVPCLPPGGIPTADLMKKGLRPQQDRALYGTIHSNRRPDEEGIKTY